MIKQFKEYVRVNKELYLPYVAQKFEITLGECCEWISELWHTFENPHMVDNMLHTAVPQQSWYVETCDTKYKRGRSIPLESAQRYWIQNQKPDQHISVFAHDETWKRNAEETGSVSIKGSKVHVPYFWIELDRKDHHKQADFNKAVRDAMALNMGHVFTSGNNSAHILINGGLIGSPILSQRYTGLIKRIATRLAGNVRFGVGTPDVYRYTKQEILDHFKECYPHVHVLSVDQAKQMTGLHQADFNTLKKVVQSDHPEYFLWDEQTARQATENLDPNIYNINSLIRQPWSIHETGEHKKVLVDTTGQFKYNPRPVDLSPKRPTMLQLYYELWEEKPNIILDNRGESSYITNRYSRWYPDIVNMTPDANGWVGPFHNVLYSDNNPSVYINLQTGYIVDYGSEYYSMSFVDFLIKTEELS